MTVICHPLPPPFEAPTTRPASNGGGGFSSEPSPPPSLPAGAYRTPAEEWKAPGWEEGVSARTAGLGVGATRSKRMMKRRARKKEEEREDREALMAKHPVFSHYGEGRE